MTSQEEQLLRSLIERVNQTQLQEKDPDAEALLNRELGANADALYILAQTVLVQNIALEQAKAQVAQLQQARPQPARANSFLGNLLGHRDPDPQPYAPAAPASPAYTQVPYQQPQYVPVQPGPPSFLRGAMQTAAGVAAGALAFEGVEAILHGLGGFGHSGFGWGGSGFGMGPGAGMMGAGIERPVEETVINNYYDEAPNSGGGEHSPHLRESADQGGAHLSNASYNPVSDDRMDDTNFDDSNLDADLDQSSLNDGGLDSSDLGDDGGGFGGDFGGDGSLI